MAYRTVFGKTFNVTPIELVDKSSNGNVDRTVKYIVDGEVYTYKFCGGGTMALGSVNKITLDGSYEEVYSAFKHIPNGSYYEEIGRQLSIELKTSAE